VCFLVLFCEVEVVRSLNLNLIQMSLKFIKDFKNKKVFLFPYLSCAETHRHPEAGPASWALPPPYATQSAIDFFVAFGQTGQADPEPSLTRVHSRVFAPFRFYPIKP
jgi:hypothetical protein